MTSSYHQWTNGVLRTNKQNETGKRAHDYETNPVHMMAVPLELDRRFTMFTLLALFLQYPDGFVSRVDPSKASNLANR